MIDEKDVLGRVERFFRDVVSDGKHCLIINKDGYFLYESENDEEPEYYPSVFSFATAYEDKINSLLSPIERIFKDAILTAVEDVRLNVFGKYPTGLLHIDHSSIDFSASGEWDDTQSAKSLYDMLINVLGFRGLVDAG